MARGDLPCPLCNQLLGLPTISVRQGTDVVKDTAVGSHVHLMITGSFTCSNGHSFTFTGDFLATRVA